jgi:hypothetical protein
MSKTDSSLNTKSWFNQMLVCHDKKGWMDGPMLIHPDGRPLGWKAINEILHELLFEVLGSH